MDILGLALNDPAKFRKDAAKALDAFSKGERYEIEVPKEGTRNSYSGYLRPVLTITVSVSESAWQLLMKAKDRMMLGLVNLIIRSSMSRLPYENYLRGDGITTNRNMDESIPQPEKPKRTAQQEHPDKKEVPRKPAPEALKQTRVSAPKTETQKPKVMPTSESLGVGGLDVSAMMAQAKIGSSLAALAQKPSAAKPDIKPEPPRKTEELKPQPDTESYDSDEDLDLLDSLAHMTI